MDRKAAAALRQVEVSSTWKRPIAWPSRFVTDMLTAFWLDSGSPPAVWASLPLAGLPSDGHGEAQYAMAEDLYVFQGPLSERPAG